jgi:sirohydrochlorin ferrochelatase
MPLSDARSSLPTALLLVDHGSRLAEANRLLEALAETLRRSEFWSWVVVAHMEIAPPTLAEAFSKCVADGARRIVIVPYFLASGAHATGDIPRLAAEAAAPHPGVAWALAEPLGYDERLANLIADRARAALKSMPQ